MADRLGLLMATESEDLAARVGEALAAAGLAPAYGLAASPRALALALDEEPWDLVICDMDLPGLPWREALDMVRVSDCDAPFLVLASGLEPHEATRAALECIAAGAHDLILDGDWRTPAVVARVLREARGLREMARVERDLRQAERRYRDMLDADVDNLPLHVLLARAKREWERTFDSVQDPIVIFDADLRVRRMNLALAERLGMHPREAVGRTCMALLDLPGHSPEVCGRILAMADGGAYSEELSIPALGGEFLVTVSPLFMDESVPAGTVLVAHDVTRRRDLEARLRQAQKMEAIGTLAGGIAHDFNNILGVIMGYAEMARDSLAPSERASDAALGRRLGEILKAGRRARDLIHQILTFSRQEHGRLTPMLLAPVVKEVAKMVQGSLPQGVTMRLDLAAQGAATPANLTQVHQVLMNLCANAVQAMADTGGELGMTLAEMELDPAMAEDLRLEPGPHLRLTVSDQGPGIDADIMDSIFDPFFTTKPPGQGTGMGLALVHGIVRGHGGAVTVDSEPGRGAAFHVWLPAVPDGAAGDEPDAPVDAPPPAPGPDARARVLVVDDEQALARITAESLAAMGFEALAETDPRAALERFRADPDAFDVALVDLVMPALPGPELMARMLELRPGLPVAACTGFAQSEAVDAVRALGVTEILHKPVPRPELVRAMARLLGKGKET